MSGIPLPPAPGKRKTAPDPRAHFRPETIAAFEACVKKLPQKRAALIPILHLAQDEKGWLSMETIEAVAAYLGLPAIQAWEVASFYPMFHRSPVGRHVIWVCRNIS